jgi:hypothetical protein
VGPTDPAVPLSFKAYIDDVCFFETQHLASEHELITFLDDDTADHVLRFCMDGKTQDHTQLDVMGNIVKDARIWIRDVAVDNIMLGQVFLDRNEYHHDFNGSQAPVVQSFFGEMGCNGQVQMAFTTPMYLWLLENI